MQVIFWFLTPILGFFSIVGSRAVGGLDIWAASSYDGAVSHFYFVSFSILAVALAEIAELALHTDKAVRGKSYAAGIAFQLVLGIVLIFLVGGIYFLSTQADLAGTSKFTSGSFWSILAITVSSSALGLFVRSQLESVRN